VRDEQLADKNLVKRFVLKRCVYGVDKNPMAVELAKVSLWLHTFTAGAPLSFLNHHLKCGDSLYGEWVRKALDAVAARGALLISDAVRKAEGAIAGMELVENLTDAEIAEVRASASAFHDVEERTEPLRKFLDFWHALKWLDLSEEEAKALGAALDGAFGPPLAVLGRLQPLVRPAGLSDEALRLFDEGGEHQIAMSGLGGAGTARDFRLIGGVIERAHALAAEQRFLHWQIAFPGVWRNWTSAAPDGGFDAVIGNPPWDRMKMQEVEWFAARAPVVAKQARAADRKTKIVEMKVAGNPLIAQYERAAALAEKAMQLARRSGDYPLLSKGDINIYALFVERAQALIKPDGIAGLLVPSGIASDYGPSAFFRQMAAAGRVQCLFDFENRGIFFPDVHNSFKFCTFVCGGQNRSFSETECAFFLHSSPEFVSAERRFVLTPADFALVNPNTGTAPIFRTRRDAELTTAIYRRLPVLVDRSSGAEKKAWPVRYITMFHMTNDSHLFWTRERLEQEGAYQAGLGRWRKGELEWVPLYEGKMVQAFDHRAADVVVNPNNVHRPAQPEPLDETEHADPARVVTPQYSIKIEQVIRFALPSSVVGFKEVTAPTNERGMIAAFLPPAGYGNTIPVIYPEQDVEGRAESGDDGDSRGEPATPKGMGHMALWLGCLNSFVLDFCARSKIQGQHLNWFIVEQLPVVPAEHYARRFGARTAAEIVKDHVLRLTYTAHDMAGFARDMGYVNSDGSVKAPIVWNEAERRQLRARLDALYFLLYGVADEDDIRYILSTFPIVERKDRSAHDGCYLTAELILWHKRALEAGDPDAFAPEADLIRAGRAAKARAA
jgi:hypothetical protein